MKGRAPARAVLKRRVLFSPADLLSTLFASLLLLAGALRWHALGDPRSYGLVLLAALVPFALAWLRARNGSSKVVGVLCDFGPIVPLLIIFDNLGPFIRAVHPVDMDAYLIAFDRWLFGTDPTRALEAIATPFLSDILTVCYALYFFHPVVLGGLVWADDRRRAGMSLEFPRYAFTVIFVFYVSYAGYFAVPAIGPRFTVAHSGPVPRGTVSRVIDSTLDHLEKNKRNCFPSGHTMVVLTVLAEGRRRGRGTFWGFLPFAIGLILATVYGRYHYVADVLAGFVLAFACVPLAHHLYAWLSRRLPARPMSTT